MWRDGAETDEDRLEIRVGCDPTDPARAVWEATEEFLFLRSAARLSLKLCSLEPMRALHADMLAEPRRLFSRGLLSVSLRKPRSWSR